MRRIHRYLFYCLMAGTIAVGTVGCATQKDVRRIVAETNAAMMSPYLDKAGENKRNDWKDPVEKIDRLIAANPDQKTLVNHLRVRQAMLLTVYQRGNLAKERWKLIDGNALTTERDKALYNNWPMLVWWYKRAPDPAALDEMEQRKAINGMNNLNSTIKNLKSMDVLIYLSTIQAQMALKLSNDADVSSEEMKKRVSANMVADLQRYVETFTEEDHTWVQENPKTAITADGMIIGDFRNRVWLREMIRQFLNTAENLGLSQPPEWKPEWIKELVF